MAMSAWTNVDDGVLVSSCLPLNIMHTTCFRNMLGMVASLFCFVQMVMSAIQVNSGTPLDHVWGTTMGSVELALCLAICLPIVMWAIIDVKSSCGRLRRVLLPWYLVCMAGGIILLVVLSSRASWLASLAGCAVVVFKCAIQRLPQCAIRIRKFAMIVMVGLCGLGVASYYVRTSSADGRMLIWKISVHDFLNGNISLLPSGKDFSVFIGEAQEHYFSSQVRPVAEQFLAGAPNYAYNEWLQMVVEWGVLPTLVVIVVVVLMVMRLVKNKSPEPIPILGGIVAVVVLSMFSYPLRCISSLWLVAMLMTCGVVTCLSNRKAKMVVLVVCVPVVTIKSAYDYHRATLCQKIIEECRIFDSSNATGAVSNHLAVYERMTPYVDNEPEFLLYYAKALFDAHNYHQCIAILRRARLKSGDPIFFLIEGKCRQQQRQYTQAEQMYLHAYYRIPHKVYPLYLLMNLYDKVGNATRVRDVALKILSISPKVPSQEFYYIQQQARKAIEGGASPHD